MITNSIFPYVRLMRFDKPIGTLLLLWPTLWALVVASDSHPPIALLMIFSLGVIIMRAAGCVINDIADAKWDGHVKRTNTRPLATGDLTRTNALWLFFILMLMAAMLLFLLPLVCLPYALMGALMTAIYPFTKTIFSFTTIIFRVDFCFRYTDGLCCC